MRRPGNSCAGFISTRCTFLNIPGERGQGPLSWKARVRNRRSDILLDLEAELSDAYRRSFLGKEEEVLLEERVSAEGRDYMIGHTRQYVKAVVPYREGLKNVTVRGKLERMVTDEILFLAEE